MRFLTFLKQPWHRKTLVLETLLALLYAWWLVRFRAFRDYSDDLGAAHSGEHHTDAVQDTNMLLDIRWAVKAVNRSFGDRFTCLMQGMAAKAILSRRDVPNTLVLGAKINRSGGTKNHEEMAAHAWLWAGGVILLGGESREGFLPVASYHSD